MRHTKVIKELEGYDDSPYWTALEKAAADQKYKAALISFLKSFMTDGYSAKQLALIGGHEGANKIIAEALSSRRGNESKELQGLIWIFQHFLEEFGQYPKLEDFLHRQDGDGPRLLLR